MTNTNFIKPNLFIVGGPKCGTTSLHYYLQQHPDVFMSYPKELYYLMPDIHPSVIPSDKEYLEIFKKGANKKIRGESTPYYIYSHKAPYLIKEMSPDAKIIIMVRNPVKMVYSLYAQNICNSIESAGTFEEALNNEKIVFLKHLDPALNAPQFETTYTDMVSLSPHIKRYIEIFGKENVMIINFDHLSRDVKKVCREVFEFIKVDPEFNPDTEIKNQNMSIRFKRIHHFLNYPPLWLIYFLRTITPSITFRRRISDFLKNCNLKTEPRSPIDQKLEEQLKRKFQKEIDSLAELLNEDLSAWYK